MLLLASLAAGIGCKDGTAERSTTPKLDTEYQAVVLTNGQVLVGKLEGLGSPYPVLRDVFAVRVVPDDPQNPQKATNLLISRAREWHSPAYTVLSAHSILAVEPVTKGSRLELLLAEEKKHQASPK